MFSYVINIQGDINDFAEITIPLILMDILIFIVT